MANLAVRRAAKRVYLHSCLDGGRHTARTASAEALLRWMSDVFAVSGEEHVANALGRPAEAPSRSGDAMLVTADHGNAEQMLDRTAGQPHTASLAPLIYCGRDAVLQCYGALSAVGSTMLQLMNLSDPQEMIVGPLLLFSEASA